MAYNKDKDSVLADIIASNLLLAEGGSNSQLMADRALALDYYYMRQKPDGIQNGSQVIAGELSAAVEATLSNIMGAISSDCLANFKPTGSEDEDQAVLESQVIQNKILSKGFMSFQTAIKDALILRNGYIKVWVKEDEVVETKQLYFPTREDALLAIAGLQQDSKPNESLSIKPVEGKSNYLRLKKTTIVQQPMIAAIPPENICYSPNWETHNFDDVPFFAEKHYVSRSDLVKMGFSKDIVNELKPYSNITDHVKNIRQRETNIVSSNKDKSMDIIEYYETYVLHDSDGDGIAERHRVIYSDRKILEDEIVSPYIPYVTAIALVKQHSAQGMSLFDKLKHIQEINTGLTRALLNNVNIVNRPRVIYNRDAVDTDDLTNPDPFAAIGTTGSRPVQDLVSTIGTEDLSPGILANLNYMKQNRDELGGSALQISSGETAVGTAVGSQGLDRVYSAREMLVALMTENLVETLIKGSFLLMHKVLREFWIGPMSQSISGIWQETIPAEWQPRNEIDIKVGLSVGERLRKTEALNQLIGIEVQLAQLGQNKILIDPKTMYNTLIDWSRQNYLSNPERYFINPDSEESLLAAQQQELAAQELRKEQKNLMTHALKLQELELALKKHQDDQKIMFEKWKTSMENAVKMAIEEAKIVGGAVQQKLAGSTDKIMQSAAATSVGNVTGKILEDKLTEQLELASDDSISANT